MVRDEPEFDLSQNVLKVRKPVARIHASPVDLRGVHSPAVISASEQCSFGLKTALAPPAISFAGCAWLLPYHLGAAHGLARHFSLDRPYYLGASSGAIAAVACASGLLPSDVLEQTLRSAARHGGSLFGPFGRMSALVHHALDEMLPFDAHERVAGRFFASVTAVPGFRNRIEPHVPFRSRSELIALVLASCYIPFYYERVPFFRGAPCLDGGATNVLPVREARTLTISPIRSHRADIRPRQRHSYLRVLFPEPRHLRALFAEGERDALRFVEARLECRPPRV